MAILKIFFFLFPLFYLTTTSESYEYNKMTLLVATTLVLLILFTLKIIKKRQLTVVKSTFGLPLFFLSAITIISTLFQSPNLTLTLTTPLSTSTILAGFLFYLLLINLVENEEKERLSNILVIPALFISFYTIFQALGILPQNSFTPAGSLLATATFLAVISVYLLAKLVIGLLKAGGTSERYSSAGDAVEWSLREAMLFEHAHGPEHHDFRAGGTSRGANLGGAQKSHGRLQQTLWNPLINIILHILTFLLIGGTTIFLTIHLLTTQKPIILPLNFGWMILIDILKDARTMLLGIGPANFVTAFTLGKDVLFNQTPYWNILFTSSSSFFLNLATEVGIFSGLLYLVIFLRSLRLPKSPMTITLLFSLFLQVFLPSNMSVFITTIILLAQVTEKKTAFTFHLEHFGKGIYLLLLPTIIFSLLLAYFGGRAYLAEVVYKQSLDALLNNRGHDVYNLQIQALTLNPYLDRYHAVFSQTNLALANALASQQVISDEDKQRIPRLVQQAIDQARTAVTLYRTNVVNWDNLARIYAALTNYAKDADMWAETSYQQKLLLDPLNPNARLSFGGFYLTLAKWGQAENLFRQAVNLKPDFANAHFNLAVALRQQKKYREAYQELQTALVFVLSNSTDSAKIKEELALLPPEAATDSGVTLPSSTIPQTLETVESSPSSLKNPPDTKPTLPEPPITP